MRLMRSHNLAYFRWFLEHKKSRLHIAVQTGFNAYSGNMKYVLCDRMKWYHNTLSLCSSRSQSSSSLIAVATHPSCISLDGWSTNLSLFIVL